jgi:peptide deformylase
MLLPIVKLTSDENARILQTKSVDVVVFDQELRDFCANLVETMYANNGVGLAAPQVGRNVNIFVMRTVKGLQENRQDHIVLINPHTIIEVGDKITDQEGCLSLPGLFGDVERFPTVGCVYWDVTGQRHSDVFQDFQARIYQHENDHLDGVLYPVRATKTYRVKTK